MTYGDRLGQMRLRTAVLGGEIAVGLVYCVLQVFSHTFCANRDPRDPLRPCSKKCHCAKVAIYDVHGLNETALYKVSEQLVLFQRQAATLAS